MIYDLDQKGQLVRGWGTWGNYGSVGVPSAMMVDGRPRIIGATASGHWCYFINPAAGYTIAKHLFNNHRNDFPGYNIKFGIYSGDMNNGEGHQIVVIEITPTGGGAPLRLYVDTWAYQGPMENNGLWVGFKRPDLDWTMPHDKIDPVTPLDEFINRERAQDKSYQWSSNPQKNPFSGLNKGRGGMAPARNMDLNSCSRCKR